MNETSEKTFLLPEDDTPAYIFGYGSQFQRRYQTRKFQCCVATTILSIILIIITGLIIFISIGQNEIPNGPDNNTNLSIFFTLTQKPFEKERVNLTDFNDSEKWDDIINIGVEALQDKDLNEHKIKSLPIKSPGHRHQMVVSTSLRARNISRIGYIEDHATQFLIKKYPELKFKKVNYNSSNDILTDYCKKEMECNKYQKFRSYDGTCNNLKHPESFGVALTPFRRALAPDYADGINKPRSSKLPSARTVSLVVHRPYYRSEKKFSVMLAVWGQFLDHDITATAISQKSDGESISCCDSNSYRSPECFPVLLDQEDPFREFNVSCIEFVRSAPAPKCYLGAREQINQVSSYIDGSVIYSANEDTGLDLRTLENGTLKMLKIQGRELLPVSENLKDGCNRENEAKNGRYCFVTGDNRANENLHLTSMHLIWARQHNSLAKALSSVNPQWNDERLFQEARKIIAAQLQHITYNEFLPILLGDTTMKKYDLSPKVKGFFTKYNDSIDPTIANEFAAAAFRFAHSIIPSLMKLLSNDTSSPEFISTHKMLFDPFKLYDPTYLDKTLKGAINTTIEATDSYFTRELKNHMFEKSEELRNNSQLCGLDLVSLNIQRGRDHGLAPYIKWRNVCGLKEVKNYEDLKKDFFEDSYYNIKSIYRSVEDIDLYTGALSEIPLDSSILGPTLTCIIKDQFIRLKYGDRFWYENPPTIQTFTEKQLNELRKTTLAGIICNNSDNIDSILPFVMQRFNNNNNSNINKKCSDILQPNLSFWKDYSGKVTVRQDFMDVISFNNSNNP